MKPYRITTWAGDFHTIGTYSTFAQALVAYANHDGEKTMLNDDRRDENTTGLTDDEKEALYALPTTRRATATEFLYHVAPMLGPGGVSEGLALKKGAA